MRVKEAEDLFYALLNETRLKGQELEVTFITGVGLIQNRLKELAVENALNHYVPMNNRGCLIVEIE